MAFHCYIPPDMVPNNSPNLQLDSIWVGCVNDTSQLSYHISDLDGDSVVVFIASPLTGSNWGIPFPQPSNFFNMAYSNRCLFKWIFINFTIWKWKCCRFDI